MPLGEWCYFCNALHCTRGVVDVDNNLPIRAVLLSYQISWVNAISCFEDQAKVNYKHFGIQCREWRASWIVFMEACVNEKMYCNILY